jgi:hypothetical protein
MDVRNLAPLGEPTTEAWREIGELIDRRIALVARVDALDHAQRSANEAANEAADAVAQLERESLGGESVSATAVKTAEQALSRARFRALEPWAERRAGASAAVADLDRDIGRLVVERFDDLVSGLVAEGEQASRDRDAAASAVIEAFRRREEIANRMNALSSMIRPTCPGDVAFSRAEALARAADALLNGGGERPPSLVHDPRQPRYAAEPTRDDEAVIA